MLIKTTNLSGQALDWAVAKALGRDPVLDMESHGRTWPGWWLRLGGEYEKLPCYSTDWAVAGPVIEQHWLDMTPWPNESDPDMRWECVDHDTRNLPTYFGPTPMIAAMRCLVASKLGDQVDLPDSLMES